MIFIRGFPPLSWSMPPPTSAKLDFRAFDLEAGIAVIAFPGRADFSIDDIVVVIRFKAAGLNAQAIGQVHVGNRRIQIDRALVLTDGALDVSRLEKQPAIKHEHPGRGLRRFQKLFDDDQRPPRNKSLPLLRKNALAARPILKRSAPPDADTPRRYSFSASSKRARPISVSAR